MTADGGPVRGVPARYLGEWGDPLGVALSAGLDLARMELSGAHLDHEEKAVLDVLDEMGHVRSIAASDADDPVTDCEVPIDPKPDRRSTEP